MRYDKVDRIVRQNELLFLYFYSDQEEEVLEERSFKVLYRLLSISTPISWRVCIDSWK